MKRAWQIAVVLLTLGYANARGAPEVAGALSKEEIRDTIRRHVPEVKGCYENALTHLASGSGRVNVTWTIIPSGAVRNAEIAESTFHDQMLEDCILKQILTWQFPRPRGNGQVKVAYPFLFQESRTGIAGSSQGGATAAAAPSSVGGTYVKIQIESALIGPGKADGTNWDGPGRIDPKTVQGVGGIMSQVATGVFAGGPAGALVAVTPFVAGPTMSLTAKPDTFGTVDANWRGGTASVKLPKQQDTITPTWAVPLEHIKLTEELKLRITLKDKDLVNDDDMGVAILDYRDVVAALENGKVYPVAVGSQTQNQVLFISITVEREDAVDAVATADLLAEVERHRADISRCVRSEPLDPLLFVGQPRGLVTARWVTVTGRTGSQVVVDAAHPKNIPVARCIKSAIETWQFKPGTRADGRDTTFAFNLDEF
jgi:hypothetical protein